MSRVDLYLGNPDYSVVTGACPHDCPDTCSWQVAVEKSSGRAVDIWGHADHPITQGRLCGKVDRYLERTYHAGRLATPLRRVGPKGSGQYEPVGWDEAVAAIAGRLRAIIGEHGAEAVLPYSYSGTLGFLQGEGMATRFFNRMGASRLARTICSEAGFEGYLYTIGAAEGMLPEDFAHARLILIWGSNTLTSNQHLWPFIQAARKAGGRVLVIDPANTRTAQAADEWIAIRPGTDGALALAIMHIIVGEGLHDADYVSRYTLGFDELAARLQEWTPARAAEITGVPVERIVALARDYATTRPAAIRINYGLQRHYGGGMAVRTITCLPALVGAWRDHGGGIQLSSSGMFRHLEKSGLYAEGGEQRSIVNGQLSMVNEEDPGSPLAPRPSQLPTRPSPLAPPRTINMNRLGDALSLDPTLIARAHYRPRPVDRMPLPDEAGPPVMALIVYNSNPAAVTPDQPAVLAGLRRDDLFTVVLENFQTDTADYADYILPATTQLEHWDIHRAYGHAYLSLNRPAIAPLGEALPNSEIFRRLAAALGYADPCFVESDEEILRAFVAAQTHERFAGLSWERLLAEGFYRVNVPEPYLPFAEGNFPTPSGRCEFYSARMADDGYDPLPGYTAPKWQEAQQQRSMVNGQRSIVDGADSDSPPATRPSQLATPESPLAPRLSPLVCISPPAHSFLNTTFANVPRFLQREAEPLLHIHPDDAALRQIVSGSRVRVCNAQGEVTLTAQVTGDIIPGTVLAPGVWWAKFSPDGRNINQVTPAEETDMGASGMFYDTAVWVEPTR
ncbi:MAG: molybdopterin oxidoreductase family protein [Caldilineaceae bacterium]|nr:molybdopterin oxidoreductase family protein [Caldilineaceae bacterium]